jgi:hypothetical protein
MPRFAAADAVEALLDCGKAFVDQRLELIVSEDVGPILRCGRGVELRLRVGLGPVELRSHLRGVGGRLLLLPLGPRLGMSGLAFSAAA